MRWACAGCEAYGLSRTDAWLKARTEHEVDGHSLEAAPPLSPALLGASKVPFGSGRH
jgi:hypothetical protein